MIFCVLMANCITHHTKCEDPTSILSPPNVRIPLPSLHHDPERLGMVPDIVGIYYRHGRFLSQHATAVYRVIWTFTLQPENLYYICRPSKWQMHWLHVGQLFFILPWKLEVVSQPVQGMYHWKYSWWFGSKIRNNRVDRNGHIPRSLVHSVWLQQVPPDRYEHLWWKPFELDERCA